MSEGEHNQELLRNPSSLVPQPSLIKARAFGLLVYLNSTALVMVGGKDPFGFPANSVEILDGDSWKTLVDLTPEDHQYSNNPTKSCIAYLQVSRQRKYVPWQWNECNVIRASCKFKKINSNFQGKIYAASSSGIR